MGHRGRTHSRWCNVIGGNPNHILLPPILRRVEGQRRLPRQDLDEPLLRCKLPLQVIARRSLEVYGDPAPLVGVVVRIETIGSVLGTICYGDTSETGRTAERSVEGD
jgi:hypothetical protein